MKMKYCGNCGSINISLLPNGINKCNNCNSKGNMKEGPIDEINSFQYRIRSGQSKTLENHNISYGQKQIPAQKNNNDIAVSSKPSQVQQTETLSYQKFHSQSLKERLKNMKNDDVEIF